MELFHSIKLIVFLCHKIIKDDCMKKKKQILGQDLSWIIDLNFNGAKPVTDNGQ